MKEEIEKLTRSLMAKQRFAWDKYMYYKKLPSLNYKVTEQRWYSKYEAYGFCIDRLLKISEEQSKHDNPYLLEGDELKRTIDARKSGKTF